MDQFFVLVQAHRVPILSHAEREIHGDRQGFQIHYSTLNDSVWEGKTKKKRMNKKNDFKFTKTINAPFSEPFVQTDLVSLYRIVASSWLIAPHCIVTIFVAHEKFLSFRLRLRLNPLEPSHLALVNVKDCVLF